MKIEFVVEGKVGVKKAHRQVTLWKCTVCGKRHKAAGNRCRRCQGGPLVPEPLMFKDPATKSYERRVREALQAVYDGPPLEEAIRLGWKEYRAIPKSFSKKKRAAALEDRVYPTTRPDMSNAQKGLEDALNGIAFRDDAQIVRYTDDTGKYYGIVPRLEVMIETLDEDETTAVES